MPARRAGVLMGDRSSGTDSSSSCSSDESAPPPRTAMTLMTMQQQYPHSVAVDFTRLRTNALRRYMAYYGIQEIPGCSKEHLAAAVARHFSDECKVIEENDSIGLFVSYIKGPDAIASEHESVAASVLSTQSPLRSPTHSATPVPTPAPTPAPTPPVGRVRRKPVGKENVPQQQTAVVDELLAREQDYHAEDDEDDEEESQNEEEATKPKAPHTEDTKGVQTSRRVLQETKVASASGRKRKAPAKDKTVPRRTIAEPSPRSRTAVHPVAFKKSASQQIDEADGASSTGANHKRKKRKERLYCVCKGSSFGNMIACDNKKCLDRSNWYHMNCVGLDASEDPPETWFCPSCQEQDPSEIPENQYRKPVASVTYGDMISHALSVLPGCKGSFKEICDFVEHEYESQLNWKLESDQRKSPVWKSSVRKILFSNIRFRKHPEDKGLFCLAS